MEAIRCTYCGTTGLEEGFIEDKGEGPGFLRWIAGPLERGVFGARRAGRQRWQIHSFRCPQCSHLELFARYPSD